MIVSQPGTYARMDRRTSGAIGVARVICILGVVYAHAWSGLTVAELAAAGHSPQGLLRWSFVELLGTSAVPLLGMISGWLVADAVRKRAWAGFMAGKARTLLAPLVLWNALAVLLVCGAASAGLIAAPTASSWSWTINELFCLARPPDIDVQMPFLRDLFVCMALSPLLARLPNWALAAVGVAVLGWAVSGVAFPLLLRPSILAFFVAGMFARRTDAARWIAARPIALTLAPYVVLALVKVWFETGAAAEAAKHVVLMAGLDLSMRTAAALFFWSLAWRLAPGRLGASLLRAEPYAFLMFCAHLIMIWLAGPLIGLVSGPLGSPLYPVFLVAQPFLALAATVALGRGLMRVSPAAAGLLSGGRLKAERPAARRLPAPSRPTEAFD
jgi:hypothetical protein